MDYQEALRFLYSFVDFERQDPIDREFNLDNYRGFLDKIGNPHTSLVNPVLIAGTKGKGSTACLLSSALKRCGLRVGTFTSPHLISPTERIAVDLSPIRESDFARWITYLRPYLEQTTERCYRTVFETMTAIAFLHFIEKQVDVAVLEVGVGGNLDATNVVDPIVSVITPVGLDHTGFLGSTLAEITEKKAGIIRRQGKVVSAPQEPEALAVIERTVALCDAQLITVGRDVPYHVVRTDPDRTTFSVKGNGGWREYQIQLLGRHQAQNAATTLATIWQLQEIGLEVSDRTVAEGLLSATLPGRFQVIETRPEIILDGAHNPTSMHAVRQTIDDLFGGPQLVVVFAMMLKKDIQSCLRILAPIIRAIVCTRPDFPRACPPEELAQHSQKLGIESYVAPNSSSALDIARSLCKPIDRILVTGSFYLVGEVLQELQTKL
jgi:dihydrofolate synthase/folylpolyglutamate synthase